MNFIYNLTKLRLNKLTREKQHYQTLHYKYMPYFCQNSGMSDLFFCMEPAKDTELLYHTLDLHALVRKIARHLQDASMLVELNKYDVII